MERSDGRRPAPDALLARLDRGQGLRLRRRRLDALPRHRTSIRMKPQGKSLIGRGTDRFREDQQGLGLAGRAHLEDVHRGVDGRIEDRDDADASRLGELLDHSLRCFIRELGNEHGEERVLYGHGRHSRGPSSIHALTMGDRGATCGPVSHALAPRLLAKRSAV